MKIIFSLVLTFFYPAVFAANPASVGLIEALKRGEEFNPSLKSAKFKEQAADQDIAVERSRYMPDLSAAAVASTGNPGSFSMFDVDSELSSAQRVGAGGALVLKQSLWDFGRTSSAVESAKARKDIERGQIFVTKADVEMSILRTYLSCAFLRAQVVNARFTAEQAKLLAGETDRFVRSGQRSIVERYLVDAEAKDAETRIAEYSERLKLTEERLALETGRAPKGAPSCTELPAIAGALSDLERQLNINPFLDVQKARVQLARSRLAQSKAESRPLLYGMATGGYFDDRALKEKTIYAAGVGIKVPLFEGFRLDSTIGASQAELHAEEAGLESSQLAIDRSNSQFDEQIQALTVRIAFLEKERVLAKQVFNLAKKRYVSLQGTMIDLRESIRNMNRILTSTDEAYRDLYLARGQRAFLNGSSPP